MGPAVSVRRAVPGDVETVAGLELDAFPQDAWTVAYLDEILGGRIPGAELLVAELDGTVVGHAIASTVFEVAELQRIAVDAGHRRHGVARTLLAAVVDRAARAGAERLLLEVRDTNAAALGLYAATDFTELDRRPRYYSDGTTAVVLELTLPDLGAAAEQSGSPG